MREEKKAGSGRREEREGMEAADGNEGCQQGNEERD